MASSKRLTLAVFVITLTACVPARVDTTPPSPIILALVTWNMNAGRGDLPRLVADLEAGRLTGRVPADFVVLLQEASDGQRDIDQMRREPLRLAREKSLSAFFTPVRDDGRRIRGNAIVATRPLLDTRAIDLPRERQRRMAVVAEMDVGGHRMFVASVHLENRVSWLKGGLLSDKARGRQAEALVGALPAAEPGILGGDMNTWLGEREPAWRAFARRFEDTPPARLRPTLRDRLVLDHLFFDLPPEWHASRRVLEDAYGSDHHPVVGVIF